MATTPHALRLLAHPLTAQPTHPKETQQAPAKGNALPLPDDSTQAIDTLDPFALHRAARRWRSRALSLLLQRQLRRLGRALHRAARGTAV